MNWTHDDEHSWHAENDYTIYEVHSWGRDYRSSFQVWHRGVQLQRGVYIPSLEAAQAIAQQSQEAK